MTTYTEKLARARAKEQLRKDTPLVRFRWVLFDHDNYKISPIDYVEARDFGHAMQKIVASLPIDQSEIARIEIFR